MRLKLIAVALFGAAAFLWGSQSALNRVAEAGTTSARATAAIERQTGTLKLALSEKGLELGQPVFLRIYKSSDGHAKDGQLQAFVENNEGQFALLKAWDICTYSGDLGPKFKEGDGQSPEGFYFVRPGQMNPNSSYHLSFNLGFPNAYDRAHGRTGSFLMVHGDCVSIGCYAMTDEGIEEIYTLMSAAFNNGQSFIRVHAFPFPMTEANLSQFQTHKAYAYWQNLQQGWNWFETTGQPPNVTVSDKTYAFSIAE